MHFKKISICLMALGLTACSTHRLQTQANTVLALEQKAIQASNAMYNTSSFDFKGSAWVNLSTNPKVHAVPQQNTPTKLDRTLERQLDLVFQAQNLKLTAAQKQALYKAIALEHASINSAEDTFQQQMVSNFLSNMQIDFDGSVHYKDKQAAFNMTAQYQQENLLIQARLPMVIDLKNHKLYMNYMGVIPALGSKQQQKDYAFVDFSKHRDLVDNIEFKKIIQYLEEATALAYVTAQSNQLQSIAPNSEEKALGAVEKIRLNASVEEMIIQSALFNAVNEPYLKSIFDVDKFIQAQFLDASLAKETAVKTETTTANAAATAEAQAAELAVMGYLSKDVDYSTMSKEEAEAHRVTAELSDLVSAHIYPEDTTAAEVVTAASREDDELDVGEDEEAVEYSSKTEVVADTENRLSRAQCNALKNPSTNVPVGDVRYCQYEFKINVLNPKVETSIEDLLLVPGLETLKATFSQYASDDLTSANAFKLLWEKHQPEVQQILAQTKFKNSVIFDVAIDAKGRAVRMDYDINFLTSELGEVQVKSDLWVSNYGHATPLPFDQLKSAKSIESSVQGTLLEPLLKRFRGAEEQGVIESTFVEQMDQLIEQVYASSQSYNKTFQSAYILFVGASTPELLQRYSAAELNEIARVYAYQYADGDLYTPSEKELAELQRLMKKHHLESRSSFDNFVGWPVSIAVEKEIRKVKVQEAFDKIVQQYKQPKAVFAQYYRQQFLTEYSVDDDELAELDAVAQRLGQTYVDARSHKLTEKSVKALDEESENYIDYGLYRTTYLKLLTHFK